MPQKVGPKSTLREACLHSITLNIEMWCKDYVDFFLVEGRFPTSPFINIPAALVEEIIRTLKRQWKQLRRHHVQALVVPHLEKLDFSHKSTEYLPFVLELTASRCSNLKSLNVSYNYHISDWPLKVAIPSFLDLQELNLASSPFTDEVLACMGAHSVNLKTLILTDCSRVTDAGVMSLCVTNSNGSGDHKRSGRCKKLVHLLLRGTKVGPEGVRAALENLPALRSLQHSDTATVLGQIQKREPEGNNSTRLLQDLYLEAKEGTETDTLDLCLDACPGVTKVGVTKLFKAKGPILEPLKKTKGLVELSVDGGCATQVEMGAFHRCVMPVLKRHWETLSVLHLGGLPFVCAELIGSKCSNITHLHLHYITTYDTISPSYIAVKTTKDPQVLFPNLRRLEFLGGSSRVDGSEPTLKATLMSPRLTHVTVRYTASLTDQLMADVLARNKFEHLHEWEMEYCNNVTAAPIKRLLGLQNPLRVLKLWECRKITQADAEELWELKSKNKWEIYYNLVLSSLW